MIGQHNFYVCQSDTRCHIRKPTCCLPGRVQVEAPARRPVSRSRGWERELAALQTQVKSVEETYSIDKLHLTVARGYVAKLLGNGRISRWLEHHRQEYLGEFRKLRRSISSLSFPGCFRGIGFGGNTQ
ncbi:plasmid partitioning protein RepB C-terminal domain-containing protein [Pararhizobium gei]|uniref:plasmid partitioning protein RepB C-terminal domain-containing protein n=1 Tax=Pararhizobium gei TaxID=1395951 RepID=UPI003312F8FB